MLRVDAAMCMGFRVRHGSRHALPPRLQPLKHELETILKTPAGLELLHKEAEVRTQSQVSSQRVTDLTQQASGRNIEACRAKLIRAVRRAARYGGIEARHLMPVHVVG